MATIVSSMLSTYLNVLIKDFNKNQLSLGLWSGTLSLKNAHFNEKVLHYLFKLPPALEIQSVTCDSLVYTLPWSRMFTDPLIIEFTNVKIVVAEVDHVTEQYDSMPEVDYILELIFGPLQGPDEDFDRVARKLLEDCSLLVHSMDVQIKFLNQARTGPGPVVNVSFAEFAFRSTNRQGEIVPLNESRAQGTEGNMITIWKKIDIGCVTVVFENKDFRQAMCLLQPTSAMCVMRRLLGGKLPKEVHLSLKLPLITLSWDKRSWETTMEILTAAIWCLSEKDVTKRRSADGSITSMMNSVNVQSPPEGTAGPNAEQSAVVEAVAESQKQLEGSISMDTMIKWPVVHLETHVEQFVLVFRDIAELRVDNCALSVVFDHKDNSEEEDNDENSSKPAATHEPPAAADHLKEGYTYKSLDWNTNKELMVQLSVLSVTCTSLIPKQNRMSVIRMNQEEQFLSAAFTVRPFMMFSRPSNTDPAAVEGKVLLGDISLTMPFELFKGFFELATCFMPSRPPLPMNSEVMHDTMWWLDNSSLSIKTRGLHISIINADANLPVTLFVDIENGSVTTTREEKLVCGYLNPETDLHRVELETITFVGDDVPNAHRMIRGDLVLNGLRLGLMVETKTHNIIESATIAAHLDWFRPLAFIQSVLFPPIMNESGEVSGHTRSELPALNMKIVLPALSIALSQARIVEAHKIITEFVAWGKQNAPGIFKFITSHVHSLVRSIEHRAEEKKKSSDEHEKPLLMKHRLVRSYLKVNADNGSITGSCSGKAVSEGFEWLQSFVPSSSFKETLNAIMSEASHLGINAFDPEDMFDFLKLSIDSIRFIWFYGPDAKDLAMKHTIDLLVSDFSGNLTFGKAFPMITSLSATTTSGRLKEQQQQLNPVCAYTPSVRKTVMDFVQKSPLKECNVFEIRTSFYVGKYSMFLQPFLRLAVLGSQINIQGDITSIVNVAQRLRTNWQDAFNLSTAMDELAIPNEIRELHDAIVHAASDAGYLLKSNDQLKSLLGVLLSLELVNVSVAVTQHPDVKHSAMHPALYLRLTPPGQAAELRSVQFRMQELLDRAKDEARTVGETITDDDKRLLEESETSQMGYELARGLRTITEKQLVERRETVATLEKTRTFLRTTLSKVDAQNAQMELAIVGDTGTDSNTETNESQSTAENGGTANDATSVLAASLGGDVGQMLMVNRSIAADAEKNVIEKARVECEVAEDKRRVENHASCFALQMEMTKRKRALIQESIRNDIERLKARIAEQKAELQAYRELAQHEEAIKSHLDFLHLQENLLEDTLAQEPQREEQSDDRDCN